MIQENESEMKIFDDLTELIEFVANLSLTKRDNE